MWWPAVFPTLWRHKSICAFILRPGTELLFLSTFGHPWVKVGPNTWVFEKRISVKNWNAPLPWKTKHLVLMWVKVRKKQLFIYYICCIFFFTIYNAFMICININYIISSRFPTPQTNGLGFAPLIFGMLQVLALQKNSRGEHCPISKPKATEPQEILTAGSIII